MGRELFDLERDIHRAARLPVDLRQDLLKVEENLDCRRKPDALCPGQIAVLAAVGAKAIRREVPEVGAGVAFLVATSDGDFMFSQHERTAAVIMQFERVGTVQNDLVLRDGELLHDFCGGIRATDAVHELLPLRCGNASFGGVICEREAKVILGRSIPGAGSVAYDWLRRAMQKYERAERLRPADNDEATLHWNTCARIIMGNPSIKWEEEDDTPLQLESLPSAAEFHELNGPAVAS